jgi:hypothetical protein
VARRLLMHPPMMNLPPIGPLATAGAPLTTTITIGLPALMAVAFSLGVVLVVFGIVVLYEHRPARRAPSARRKIALRYATDGSEKC